MKITIVIGIIIIALVLVVSFGKSDNNKSKEEVTDYVRKDLGNNNKPKQENKKQFFLQKLEYSLLLMTHTR